MKFSIITVCFNSAPSIERTLRSVVDQQGVEIEHIVIDGKSTDGTQNIVRSQVSPPAQFVSEPDSGIYDAMNKGISRAGGDVIGLLNADDYYPRSDVLASVAKGFSQRACDAVYGDVAFFESEAENRTVRRYDSSRFSPRRIGFGLMPAHPATFFRRQVYEKYGRFKTDYQIAADFEFIARVFKPPGLSHHYIPEVLVRMQTGGASTRNMKSSIILNQEILRACAENGIRSSMLHLACKVPLKLLELVRG